MQVMKWSVMALAVAAGSTQMAFASSQSESNGFLEDSSFDIFNRVLYMNRDFRNGPNPSAPKGDSGYREETGWGLRTLFESGFTQGTIGVGFDAFTLSSLKLDGGSGHGGSGLFSRDSDSNYEKTQSQAGGAIKFRVSNTGLKYGDMFVASPVFSTDDSRILPESATGTYLVSNEIEGLELSAGRFTAMSSQVATGRDTIDGTGLKSANIYGANYSFTDNLSAGLHYSDVEDYFKKTYLNVNWNLPIAEDQSLNFDLNGYHTKGDGDEIYGEVDNDIWSLAGAYNIGAHTFTLAYQSSSGDAGYVYGVDGGGTIYLANSVQYSDFNGKDEDSWQARYDINMASYGVPGLSFMTRYIAGDNIDVGTGTDAQEREIDIEAKYVIQDGAAKDLSFRVRNAFYRSSNAYGGDINDFRLIMDYPLDVL
ncbi:MULTISPECIES: OprD family porin [Pseudomonas]|uniref:Imipenem/basic amino acid-specific outer membrane pore n=1 Tax=Pseudomonas segetis TaxID=298908 RepID=A0A238ZN55_9PSED|nr:MULTISPECIES: OprD family porin [Pseudomonas]SNR84760.1 imipenem/basic amino acid-specific outer membrane pore [Pseudomonas segetis]